MSNPLTIPGRRLAIVGLGLAATGLGRVLFELIRHLKSNWNMTAVLHDADGSFPLIDGINTLSTHFPAISLEVTKEVEQYLKAIAPDCVLVLAQPWKCAPLITGIRQALPATKIALYIPIEGKPSGDTIANSLAPADLSIVYTHAMRAQLKDHGLNLTAIGHGFDPRCTVPMHAKNRKQLRRQLFPNNEQLWNTPLILNANRIYFRKRFDLCIAGFAKAAGTMEANLYLHIPGLSRYEAGKLYHQIHQLNIEHRVFINVLNPVGEPLPFEDLVLLMQACDVGLTTSMGEGWGLGSFEHAATGAAQIVPDHIGFRENWGPDNAMFIPCDAPYPVRHEAVDMFPPLTGGIANALINLLQTPETINLMSCRAQQNALRTERRWNFIAKQFDTALSNLIKQ